MMTSTAATHAASADRELSTKGIWMGALGGGGAGAIGNLAIFFLASAAGVSPVAEFVRGLPPVALVAPHVALASFVPSIVAAIFATVLARSVAKPTRVLLGVGVAFALFSLGGPLSLPAASTALRVVLAAMHFVAGAAILGGILRYGRAR